jgi:outer membrane protein TolC
LAAFLGLQNTNITDFTALGKSWSMASTITLPIFNWGKLQANIKSREAQHDQAFLAYQSAVLNAFKEVEDALAAYASELQRREALSHAVVANQLALDLSRERYLRGLTAFLDVLVTERSLYQAQASLVESEAAVSANLVALYKALGGGWQAGRQGLSETAGSRS